MNQVGKPALGLVPGDMVAPRARPGIPLSQRLAARGLDSLTLLVLPAVLFLLALFIYPFLYGLWLSFQPKAGGSALTNYSRFFSDSSPRFWWCRSRWEPCSLRRAC